MDKHQVFSVLAGVFVIGGYVPYIASIARGVTVPAKASWLIWASLDTVLLGGMILRHAVNGQLVGTVIVIWIVVVLAFRRGRSGWTRLDRWCLAATVLGFFLILVNPTWSIGLLACISLVGGLPTFRSAWQDPSRENRLTWTLYWLSCVLAVLAVRKWTVDSAAQPISFLITQTTMMYLLFGRSGSRSAEVRV